MGVVVVVVVVGAVVVLVVVVIVVVWVFIGGRQVVSLLRKTATTPISPCRLCFFP